MSEILVSCSCGTHWQTRSDFLSDPDIALRCYIVNFELLEMGLFLFTHLKQECKSSLTVEAAAFSDLYAGPRYADKLTGTTECPGYCLRKDTLIPCLAKCECAYIRQITDMLAQWPKREPIDVPC